MTVTNENNPETTTRWQRYSSLAWYWLRSPKLTGGLVAILVVVVLLSFVIPQQPSSNSTDAATWISSLPALVQLWGDLLYFLGFARLLHSPWFWLPAALLLLNSLIALADYGPGSWQRLKKTIPPLDWQHPLASRAEHITRLPKSPNSLLNVLQAALAAQGFFLYQSVESEQRIVGAARRRWAWFGLISLYIGLVLLVTAFLISHYFFRIEYLTLFPGGVEASRLLVGDIELAQVGAEQKETKIIFSPAVSDQPKLAFSGQVYQPSLFDYVIIWPVARESILVVEARDASGISLKLIPVQEELPPADKLNLPLTKLGEPLYFLIPSANLAVQVLPDPNPDTSQNRYNVQVRRGSDESPSENFMVGAGDTFELDSLFVTISPDQNLTIMTFFDPALPLYFLSVILIVVGVLLTAVRFLSPVQLWLVPEVKGLGGQLYGVLERYDLGEKETEFLEKLLTPDESLVPDSLPKDIPEPNSINPADNDFSSTTSMDQ